MNFLFPRLRCPLSVLNLLVIMLSWQKMLPTTPPTVPCLPVPLCRPPLTEMISPQVSWSIYLSPARLSPSLHLIALR